MLVSKNGSCPSVVYWGRPLSAGDDPIEVAEATAIDVTGGMLDEHPDLSLCPEASRSFPGQAGLVVSDENGRPLLPRFTLSHAEKDESRLVFTCRDDALHLTYVAEIACDPDTHMLTLRARLDAEKPLRLHWLAAPVLPAPQHSSKLIEVAGRWCGEFQLNHVPWAAGARLRESRTGRSGHEDFPAVLIPCCHASNMVGEAYGFHYGWSGGHRMVVEELPNGRRQVQFGHATGIETSPGTSFRTAPLYAVYSDTGLNGCAVSFQRHVRDRIVPWTQPARPRPVHYNCWEAVYFQHDIETLKEIATRAANLGAERFVLDDGWFGQRDDDTSSLGDWDVDARKYPDGLTPLINHVQGLGMGFGLWFEPEMVNSDSVLHAKHPDWVLGPEDQIKGRNQKVLDMARPEVRDYLYDKVAALLRSNAIEYIKWDHNRVLPAPDATQTRGTYALIDQLRAAFPRVEIESCASGGGRADFGMLERTQRVWLSDSNDALERLKMQHNAALFLPAAVTGSHVGPRHCHTSGRVLDIEFRAWVAAQRHMGFEMDPRELTTHEAAVLAEVTSWWKANRDWLCDADVLLLDSTDPSVVAEQHIDRAATRFVLFSGRIDVSSQTSPRPLCLAQLDPQARYRVSLRNRASASHLSRAALALKEGDLTLSGAALMSAGLRLPWSMPQSIWVLEGERIDA
jgi:alpha-galactosidase